MPVSGRTGVHGEDGFIYAYSFGLKPEEHQPSGTCNFSRIDNATLQLRLNCRSDIWANTAQKDKLEMWEYEGDKWATNSIDKDNTPSNVQKFIKVYATNYNVLRVMSGMGGLAYSN